MRTHRALQLRFSTFSVALVRGQDRHPPEGGQLVVYIELWALRNCMQPVAFANLIVFTHFDVDERTTSGFKFQIACQPVKFVPTAAPAQASNAHTTVFKARARKFCGRFLTEFFS